jgi:hypothetical protein
MIYTQSEDNRVVGLNKEFEVVFNNVPTGAGYKWVLIEHKNISNVKESFSDSERVGDLVAQKFVFYADKNGFTTLRFHLKHPWESKYAMEKVINVHVV